jgi:hypothetical protein
MTLGQQAVLLIHELAQVAGPERGFIGDPHFS